jgi:hypothetical protein
MQNVLAYWKQITTERIYAVPYSQTSRLAMVDLEDVAAVAAKVLIESGHSMAIYELAGIASLTPFEMAGIMSQKLGFPVQSIEIPILEWEARARQNGMPDYNIETLGHMFRYYDQFGLLGNPNILTLLLGRQPTSFSDFIDHMIQERIT